MKDKVLLSVFLPATRESYEFRVPYDMTVETACKLMSKMLATKEPARYEATAGADLMLCGDVPGAGEELNPNETFRALVEEGVLVDGSPVALI